MELHYTKDELAFRDEVHRFVEDNLPADIRRSVQRTAHLEKRDYVEWQRILHRRGWGAPGWPQEYGGCAWSPTRRHIFEETCLSLDAPPQSTFNLRMVGPVIYSFGTDAQKARFLPRILNFDDWWCQGYSETGAGSDLASLKTRAVADGDHYVVDGQKIWTTQAQYADLIFCLVRTNFEVKAQSGISFLLIDMASPGITLRPIITIDASHTVNEIFFDSVRVPKENLVGEEGMGWTIAKFLLGHERTGLVEVALSKRRLKRLKTIAAAERSDGGPLLTDPGFRLKVAQIETELLALEYSQLRLLAGESMGKAVGPEASILKVRGSEIGQRLTELAVEALGHYAAPFEPSREGANEPAVMPDYGAGIMPAHLYSRAFSIYGGSNEIQKNVVAKAVLGL